MIKSKNCFLLLKISPGSQKTTIENKIIQNTLICYFFWTVHPIHIPFLALGTSLKEQHTYRAIQWFDTRLLLWWSCVSQTCSSHAAVASSFHTTSSCCSLLGKQFKETNISHKKKTAGQDSFIKPSYLLLIAFISNCPTNMYRICELIKTFIVTFFRQTKT